MTANSKGLATAAPLLQSPRPSWGAPDRLQQQRRRRRRRANTLACCRRPVSQNPVCSPSCQLTISGPLCGLRSSSAGIGIGSKSAEQVSWAAAASSCLEAAYRSARSSAASARGATQLGRLCAFVRFRRQPQKRLGRMRANSKGLEGARKAHTLPRPTGCRLAASALPLAVAQGARQLCAAQPATLNSRPSERSISFHLTSLAGGRVLAVVHGATN